MSDSAIVFSIDDDDSVRRGVSRLLRSAGYRTQLFESATVFLAHLPDDHPACILLDFQMPELNGLNLQERLAAEGYSTPIVFLTGHGSVARSVPAMKKGAIDFLEKPIDEQELLTAIEQALTIDRYVQGDHHAAKISKRVLAR